MPLGEEGLNSSEPRGNWCSYLLHVGETLFFQKISNAGNSGLRKPALRHAPSCSAGLQPFATCCITDLQSAAREPVILTENLSSPGPWPMPMIFPSRS